MLLDALKDFSWYNEPENVRFQEDGLLVDSLSETDFWANMAHRFNKDDGHFFYTTAESDFTLTVCTAAENYLPFAQAGIMARLDSFNWVKASLMDQGTPPAEIGSVVTQRGHSDWASAPLPYPLQKVWYRLKRKGGDMVLSYSPDGERFIKLRQFRLVANEAEIRIGAYVCNPVKGEFAARIEQVDFKPLASN